MLMKNGKTQSLPTLLLNLTEQYRTRYRTYIVNPDHKVYASDSVVALLIPTIVITIKV